MAPKEKPYRVYRGGRLKGPARHEPLRRERREATDGSRAPGAKPARRPRRRWLKVGLIVLALVLVLTTVWGLLGYLSFRGGVKDANDRLSPGARAALAPQDGLLLTRPTNILVLGVDEGGVRGRGGNARSDAILVIRSDPDEGRMTQLSIPRDLRVQIPGRDGFDKINAAYAFGGAALAIRTVQSVTGLEINHVVVVDFSTFPQVIDALGGVSIDVPRPVLSNRFDCPRASEAACSRWKGWRFRKGEQEMDGKRALIYARIRENQLDPRESDITRGERQQTVIQAIGDEVVSFGTFLRGPFIAGDLVRPLATDLSANQLVQLGWRKFRTPDGGRLRCRLGGVAVTEGGVSYIQGSEENRSVIAMVTGQSAPQPPPPGSGPFGPGCVVGA